MTPNFIPHNQFHTGIWLLPLNSSRWYYFIKRKNNNIITNERFIDSVDKPLKELVQFLHKKNIRTTPSCSGHNYDRDYFAAIYESLKQDAEEIKTKGLQLINIESGTLHFYIDKNYILPWPKKNFISYALDYQKKGVLGLRLNSDRVIVQKLLDMKIPGACIKKRDDIVFIYTEPDGKPEEKWERITLEIKAIFMENE